MELKDLTYLSEFDMARMLNKFRGEMEVQEKEIKRLKEELQNIKELHTLSLDLNANLNLEKSNLKQDLEIHKGVSDGKTIIIQQMKEEKDTDMLRIENTNLKQVLTILNK